MESFFSTLESELLDGTSLETFTHGRRGMFEYMEGWYNPHRRHSVLDCLSPVEYEKKHQIAA